HVLEDLRLREHPPRVEHEEPEQRELGACERDLRLAAPHLVPVLVQRQVAEAQDIPRKRTGRAAEDRLDARHDLGETERLRDVVVTSRRQRLDLVLGRVLRCQEEDSSLVALLPESAAHFDSLDVGEHPVEHDEVGMEARDGRERLASCGRLLDDVILVAERRRDGVDDRGLVVDDEGLVTVLTLRLTVLDASTCKPIKGAAVDIWHCDALGVYSGVPPAAASTTFMRGIQRTGAAGVATFQTVYPGWYPGRTVHIHVKVHVGGNVVH